ADSLGIKTYLREKYNKDATYIAYGANVFDNPDDRILKKYQIEKENYSLLIARFEPENNLEMILDGVVKSNRSEPFLVIGKHDTVYGDFLKNKYKAYPNIKFIGGIYNLEELNNIRYYSRLYFHGHSVGGTNPSLLEAMASNTLICANNNEFNKGVLKENAFYFKNAKEVAELYTEKEKNKHPDFINNNIMAIKNEFSWEIINQKYYELLKAFKI
ncbi:MAG: glycosyltransferase, partial [Bacilli bacterium]